MCGIVGYIGNKNTAKDFVLNGLRALEYRGYDSAGIAILNDQDLVVKQKGRVEALAKNVAEIKVNSSIGIGHTRWATHGSPSDENAHPHYNHEKTIFVVHNGIIENYREIKEKLESEGYKFLSETDTEVIPHLIDFYLKQSGDFATAFSAAINDLEGAYAICSIYKDRPDVMYAARLSSPLVVGVGDGEYFVASDPSALIHKTKKVIFLKDYEIAEITKSGAKIHNFKEFSKAVSEVEELDYDAEEASLGQFPNYMLKEINEVPAAIENAIRGRIKADISTVKLGGLDAVQEQLKFIDRITIVACGTSYYAGLVGEYLIEEIANIPVEVQFASEFKYRKEPFSRGTAIIAISQSGETADTIAALKKIENYGLLRLGIVNSVGSTIARITDAGVYCHAGPEQSVASTKAFIAQVTILCEIALSLSKGQSKLYQPLLEELENLPKKAEATLALSEETKSLAKKYADKRDFLYIGRGYMYPCALEGALKLKEISYIHAEGCSAGEMKHGPLAMIDENFPTVAFTCDGPLLDKTLSNIEEIKARKGPVIAFATEGNKKIKNLADDVIYLPKTAVQLQPVLAVIAAQLFAYYVAMEKGLDVDRPRNLAKSVTVE